VSALLAAPSRPLVSLRLDPAHEAHEPPEARGLPRDGVRLLVSRGEREPVHARFADLAQHLDPGDLLVVNTSGTVAAAIDGTGRAHGHGAGGAGIPVVVHVSNPLPGGLWLVEVRRPRGSPDHTSDPLVVSGPMVVELHGGAGLDLLSPFAGSRRLWLATFHPAPGAAASDPGPGGGDLRAHLVRFGRPIRYRHVPQPWPLDAYQTVFATEPGSAEMPSAARPFTDRVVTSLVRRGVLLAPLVLHTGVSSLEGGEDPYPERYRVPPLTAALVNAAHARGSRVVAVGTTVVRALETVTESATGRTPAATGGSGMTHPGDGWTELVVSPERGVRAVDGLLTGWHEPEASHLWMLEAVAGRRPLELAYEAAFEAGYLWHEFGDSHLLLPYRERR
jgi:S-adenosylmethionine:tRNA ribosyltransferase-isomerase